MGKRTEKNKISSVKQLVNPKAGNALAFVSTYRKYTGWFLPLPSIGAYSIFNMTSSLKQGACTPLGQGTAQVGKSRNPRPTAQRQQAEEGGTESVPWAILHEDLGTSRC